MTAPQDNAVISLHRPDLREKFFFFTAGIVMSIPLTLLAEQLSFSLVSVSFPVWYELLSITIIAPFIEEFAKAYPMFYRHGETERSFFTIGFLAGLGFGISEFFLYVFVYSASIWTRLPVLFFHATNTSITAYGIATKKPVRFYLGAVTLHFLLNVNFFTQLNPLWLNAIAFLTSYLVSLRLHDKTRERIVV